MGLLLVEIGLVCGNDVLVYVDFVIIDVLGDYYEGNVGY